jgi:hypothetical protein
MDKAFLQTRIDKTKLLIIAYEDAALALLGGVESYSLDTSQSKQTVTQIDALKINQMIDSLYNRLVTLQARLNGGGVTVVPGW